MPSMPTLVSGGISLGVLAGLLSSVYYVLLAGLKWFGNLQLAVQNGDGQEPQIRSRSNDGGNCGRCGFSLTTGGKVRKIDCLSCGHIVCRQCSIRTPTGDCVCTNCKKFQEAQQQTADWFYEQLKQRFFNSGTVAAAAPNNTNSQDGEVRDFMESIVEGLVGDGLDNVCLRPVSTHPNYIKFCDEFHDQLALILAKFSVSLHMAITDKPLSLNDSPSVIHGDIKELIKQIMKEATNLPSFHVFSNGSLEKSIENEAGELEKKSYEDILATAILNKVVERHQQGLSKLGSNSQISVRDTNGNVVGRHIRRRRRKYKLTNKPIQDSRRRDSSSDSETNEHFPNSCDDCNWSGSTKSDPLSFTIEECIEEVVTRYSSEDERDTGLGKFLSTLDFKRRQRAPFPEFGMDIVDRRGSSPSSTADEDEEENNILSRRDPNIHVSMEVISGVDSWEENWLFQKKRLKTAGMNHSMPVPMLVPNPSEEYRVLIGDVDADETSDLSECSDSALEDLLDGPDNNVSSLHSESEHELENTDAEDEFLMQLYKANKPLTHNGFGLQSGSVLESADLVEDCDDCTTVSCSEIKSKNPVFDLNEAKNNELIVPQVDSGEGSLEIQQDSEYTEAYDSAAQLSVSKKDAETRQPDSINADSNKASDSNTSNEERRVESEESTPKSAKSNGVNSQNHEDEANDSESENFDLFSAPPRPGTIAEREHKKWLQAVPLTNNPYSKENIERRQRERMLLRRQTSNETSVEFPELTGENNASVVPIDCSGCKPNHKQYGRDYYINNASEQKEKRRDSSNDTRTDISTTHAYDGSKSQVSVRVEVEVGGRWNGVPPPATKSAVETRTHVSNLNNQQLLTTVSTTNSRDRQQVTTVSTWGTASSAADDDDYDDDHIALPSVKELAKQFSNVETDPQPQIQATEVPVQASSTPVSKNKLEVQTLPVRQVHSLTARCISKEFREGLRASNRPADYMKPVDKAESCGNISDDSGTASPTPTSNQKLCNSIAFWEQMNSTR